MAVFLRETEFFTVFPNEEHSRTSFRAGTASILRDEREMRVIAVTAIAAVANGTGDVTLPVDVTTQKTDFV